MPGGPTALYAYLHQLRTAPPSSTVRYETPPGRQIESERTNRNEHVDQTADLRVK